jgi:repressor LexA
MPLPPLTKRQRDILDFFQDYTRVQGISPTLEEIAQSLGVNRVTVFGHVAEMERKGVLKRSAPGISRGLELTSEVRSAGTARQATVIRILGTIAAGSPIEALEVPDSLDLCDLTAKGSDVFALRVRGDSMIGDSIRDGDLVLVEKRNRFNEGDIVVAVLPDEEQVTLKRIYKESGRFRLQPSNPRMKPILVESVEVRGIVMGLIRTY